MSAFGQANDWMKFWAENQKSLFQAWAEGKVAPPFAAVNDAAAIPGADAMADLLKRTMEEWGSIAKQAWGAGGKLDPEAMRKLFDPAEWKRAGSHFDLGLEKLTEGPTYATLFDLDRKVLVAQKAWLERARDTEEYWRVVQAAWTKAVERFTKAVGDARGEPITSGRAVLDLWLEIANASLVEMHRSKEFLEAQRKMTRSSTEYRLAEREIAEAFCEMHHIPTRTEMDEMQKAVTELRRELRRMEKRPSPRPSPKGEGGRRRK